MEENIEYEVLESLKILFNHTSADEQKSQVLKQWENWTLGAIYNYYMVEEQNNKVLEIQEVPMKNTLQIKTGDFIF